MQPSKMTDQELTEAVVKEVMGWVNPVPLPDGNYHAVVEDMTGKTLGYKFNSNFISLKEWDDHHYWKDSNGDILKLGRRLQFRNLEFNPTTNANHWLMVVGRMLQKNAEVVITPRKPPIRHMVKIFYKKYWHEGFGDVVGRAICEAALMAVRGGDVNG